MRGFKWENPEVWDELGSILIVKSRYGVSNNIFEPWDMQHTHVDLMLQNIVNHDDQELVVRVAGLLQLVQWVDW
jgi:hypothetical protein